jgi:ketosteroid isomerase-like protein
VIADKDSAAALERVIQRYNQAWNAHDLDAIVSLHAPDMTFENHTAGESAQGEEVRQHIAKIFETWPDIRFETRRLYARDGVVTQEWTATATHRHAMRRGDLVVTSVIALAESLREALPPARIPELPAELALRLLVRGTPRLGHHQRCHLTGRQPPQPAWDPPWWLGAQRAR